MNFEKNHKSVQVNLQKHDKSIQVNFEKNNKSVQVNFKKHDKSVQVNTDINPNNIKEENYFDSSRDFNECESNLQQCEVEYLNNEKLFHSIANKTEIQMVDGTVIPIIEMSENINIFDNLNKEDYVKNIHAPSPDGAENAEILHEEHEKNIHAPSEDDAKNTGILYEEHEENINEILPVYEGDAGNVENIFEEENADEQIKLGSHSENNRIRRPCPFCPKIISNFSTHLKIAHKDNEEVSKIMMLSSQSSRKKKFIDLMIRGIDKYNETIIGSNTPLMRLRKVKNKLSML